MTISTYNTLVTAIDGVDGWSHKGNITARLPEFIALAEVDLQIRCKLVEFEATATVTITSGTGTLPADFVGMRSVYWSASPNVNLRYITPDKYDEIRDNTGTPGFYTISGSTIRTVPTDTGSVVLTYTARFTPITASNQTNSLITNYPDVYLSGVLKQVCLWAKDDAGAQKWGALLDQALARVTVNDEQRRYAGSSLQVRAR